jgi:hypothetical protein
MSSPVEHAPSPSAAMSAAALSLIPLLYRPPASWKTDHRTRRFIALPERKYSRENDMEMLRRSVDWLIDRQDERGSFHSDDEYRQGDKTDDQLGACAMLAYVLSHGPPDSGVQSALQRGVRFHLDGLVRRSPSMPFPYTRAYLDQDSAFDASNGVWILWGGALVLKHGLPFLNAATAAELLELMDQTWQMISSNPVRNENPCHNQLLAYCEIAVLYAKAVKKTEIVREILTFYREKLRPLKVFDRGHWIYTEFNQWDANYGLLSWMSLEHLYTATGDAAFAEDADEMARYFDEMVSAGGYYWGGCRYNEGGLEEFIHLPASRAHSLGLDRLLIPEPAESWDRLILDGHYGRVLVLRLDTPVRSPRAVLPSPSSPWGFRDHVSVTLTHDHKLHQASAGGLEIIPSACPLGDGSGLTWREGGSWKRDPFHLQPPRESRGLRYHGSQPIDALGISGLSTFHRGFIWETRQWWLGTGSSLFWIVQVISHSAPLCEKIDFILGTPVLTRVDGRPVQVTQVRTAEGDQADTQGEAVCISSKRYLRIGDAFVTASAQLEFLRPDRDSFHTFPLSKSIYPRDCTSSNELRVRLWEKGGRIDCRQSLFFAAQIGPDSPGLSAARMADSWSVRANQVNFIANLTHGVWNYSLERDSQKANLPRSGFGF